MKHLKIFEKKFSITSIKSISGEYHDMLDFIKPAVIKRYNEIANDQKMNYGQDISDVYGGDSYYVIHNINRIKLVESKMHDNKYFFTLEYYDYDEEKPSTFYVPFTEDELKNTIIGVDSDKYNL